MAIKFFSIRKQISTLCLFFLLIGLSMASLAHSGSQVSNGELRIYPDPRLQGATHEIYSIYPGIKRELEDYFHWKFHRYPINIVIKSKFQDSPESLIVAYAVPDNNLVVLDYSRAGHTSANLRVTLKHELCHLLLHSYIAKDRLPKWLDEGICQVVSGSLGEIAIMPKVSLLDKAMVDRKVIPLEQLRRNFPYQKELLLLAYEEGKSFTSYVIEEFGKKALLELLNHLKEGEEFERAFLHALSISFSKGEQQWWTSLQRRDSFLARLGAYLYELLFAFGGAVTIYAFLRQWKKKRQYEDEEDMG